MPLQPVYKPFSTRPKTAARKSPLIQNHALIRDQFSVLTWLLLGALIQGFLCAFLPYKNIALVLPIVLIFLGKLIIALLRTFKVLKNPTKTNVVPYRTALAFPGPKSSEPGEPGSSPICAILLGLVSHHPLGMLAPSFKEVGDKFDCMLAELSADATQHGFLGGSAWMSTERVTSNEVAVMLYFENEDYLHAYAHGPMHSDSMIWWNQVSRQGKANDVGIMHEVFACPRKSFEGVYLNYHPTGIGATTKEVISENGQKSWVSPLVKANGKLIYSKGRMGRQFGDKEWVEFDTSLTADEKKGFTYAV